MGEYGLTETLTLQKRPKKGQKNEYPNALQNPSECWPSVFILNFGSGTGLAGLAGLEKSELDYKKLPEINRVSNRVLSDLPLYFGVPLGICHCIGAIPGSFASVHVLT